MVRSVVLMTATVFAALLALSACGDLDEDQGRSSAENESGPTATERVTETVIPEPTTTPQPTPEPTVATQPSEIDIPRYEFPSGNREVYVMDADGGSQQRLTNDQAQYHFPVWSPDGDRIAALSDNIYETDQRLVVMNADGSNRHELTSDAGYGSISWSPDGETIAFRASEQSSRVADQIFLIDADGSNQRALTNLGVEDPEERYVMRPSPDWSPDGESIVFVASLLDKRSSVAVTEVYVVDPNGDGVPTRITDIPELHKSNPVWSPDGETIAFTATSLEDHEPAIYAVNADGENLRKLTEGISNARNPSWSPDGQRIAFTRNLFGSQDIYVMDADGSNVQQLTDDDTSNEFPDWSPDGNQIAFVASRDARLAEPCSYAEEAALGPTQSFETLAWTSHQIVVGTVIEKLGPAWAEPDAVPCLQITTDYIVEVEQQYRGEPAETLRLRVRGGQIGEYEQDISTSPTFEVGDRLLLFLTEAPESELLPDAYTTHKQRAWWVSEDDQVRANSHLDPFNVVSLDEVEQRVRTSLAGDPPDDVRGRLVPLEEAPPTDQ